MMENLVYIIGAQMGNNIYIFVQVIFYREISSAECHTKQLQEVVFFEIIQKRLMSFKKLLFEYGVTFVQNIIQSFF